MDEMVLGGVILSPIVPSCVIALLLTIAISMLMVRLRAYRLFWHRPLVEVAIFCILLGLLSAPVPRGFPL